MTGASPLLRLAARASRRAAAGFMTDSTITSIEARPVVDLVLEKLQAGRTGAPRVRRSLEV